jgi:RNA polymerase sigma factor (sigma-70 family)
MNIEPIRLTVIHLERALSEMPELQRRAFQLAARDGLPYSNVAERLGISVRRLERLLAKALVAIDRQLS